MMNPEVNQYIENAPEQQQLLMQKIRELIYQEVPEVVENFKWSRPVFSTASDFAYFKTAKAYLTFGIFKFEKITEHAELLEGTGKDMRHLKIKKLEDLNPEIIKKWLHQVTK
jgi:hypothetical protein